MIELITEHTMYEVSVTQLTGTYCQLSIAYHDVFV